MDRDATIKNCRACAGGNLLMFLPMGDHPPANRFLTAEQLQGEEPIFPLNAHSCLDCGLIQVPDFIPPEFFTHYLYVPSASDTMHAHFAGLAGKLAADYVTSPGHYVADIGSNDGLFLSACNGAGLKTLGIEPATNLTEIARSRGVEVENVYFSPETARAIRDKHGAASVIVTTNTFNHIDDLGGFMEGVVTLLSDDGVFVVEVPWAVDLLKRNEFDTIYHEHLSEFSVASLVKLYAGFDMRIFGIERLEIHGGSMRVHASRAGDGRAVDSSVDDWLAREHDEKIFESRTYEEFAGRVDEIRVRLIDLLDGLRSEGKKLAGYGAPAKGNTLLNYYGIGPERLEFLADRNELKHNLYSPGMRIPVAPPERILRDRPDYLLLLAWNFADEIIRQQSEFRKSGGKFIVPIPEPVIVE